MFAAWSPAITSGLNTDVTLSLRAELKLPPRMISAHPQAKITTDRRSLEEVNILLRWKGRKIPSAITSNKSECLEKESTTASAQANANQRCRREPFMKYNTSARTQLNVMNIPNWL